MKRPSLRGLAEALGVSLSALQEARKTGRIDLTGPIDLEALKRQWIASSNVQGPAPMANREGAPEGPSLADARRRKELALAELREIELAKEKGSLIPARDVELRWAGIIMSARTRLLELPTRMKQAVPDLTSKDVETIREIVREALTDLAEGKS
jgi:phage terminase Nu1 subunit (DNA packaging protein)